MVVNISFGKNIRAMYKSGWLNKGIICYALLILTAENSLGKSIRDIDDEENAIDNIKRFYDTNDENLVPPHLDLAGFRKNNRIIPDKIPFAVTPRDYRFHLSASYLRGEPETHLRNGLIDHEYNYPDQNNDFLPQNPPYFNPYKYGGNVHTKHIPFFDYNQDYGHYGQLLNPAAPPYALNQYHDDQGPPVRDFHKTESGSSPFVSQGGESNVKHEGMEVSHPQNFFRQAPLYASESEYRLKGDRDNREPLSDFYFVALVAGCTVAAVSIIVGAGICYYRLSKSKREAADAEYPAYGVTGPSKDVSPGAADRKLAQSAHMYHYQHQKQQMIAIEKSSSDDRHCSASDVDSEEDEEVPDYTVYECPGLAPTDNMEVKNPLFSDDPTPATPSNVTEQKE